MPTADLDPVWQSMVGNITSRRQSIDSADYLENHWQGLKQQQSSKSMCLPLGVSSTPLPSYHISIYIYIYILIMYTYINIYIYIYYITWYYVYIYIPRMTGANSGQTSHLLWPMLINFLLFLGCTNPTNLWFGIGSMGSIDFWGFP